MQRENIKRSNVKAQNNIKGNHHKVISYFFCRNFTSQKGVTEYIWSCERQKLTARMNLPSITLKFDRNKKFCRQTKAKIMRSL